MRVYFGGLKLVEDARPDTLVPRAFPARRSKEGSRRASVPRRMVMVTETRPKKARRRV